MTNWKEKAALATTGSWADGFWEWKLEVDLEDLQAGKGEEAITIDTHHDNSGMSRAEYNGIIRSYKLPDGVKVSELQQVVDDIVNRAGELTEGFSTEWVGSDNIARWADDTTEQKAAFGFWEDLPTRLTDLECAETYDLDSTDNLSFVREAAQGHDDYSEEGTQDELASRIEGILADLYKDDSDTTYINFSAAASSIAQTIIENRED